MFFGLRVFFIIDMVAWMEGKIIICHESIVLLWND